jgi:hypothetical protein
MKRRDFITQLSLGATGLVFSNTILRGFTFPSDLFTRKDPSEWPNVDLAVPGDIMRVVEVMQAVGFDAFLKGGCVASMMNGHKDVECVDLICDPNDFSALKKRLVKLGVIGIPQSNAPVNTIQFEFADRTYFCEAISIDSYLQRNAQKALSSRLIFKHSTILFQPNTMKVWDPYSLSSGGRPIACEMIRDMRRDPVLVRCVAMLQAELEQVHFQLLPDESVATLNDVWNIEHIASDDCAPILLTFVDYGCDIADARGLEFMKRYLSTPLLTSAVRQTLGLDTDKLVQTASVLRGHYPGYSESTLLVAAIMAASKAHLEVNTEGQAFLALYRQISYSSAKQRTLVVASHLADTKEVRTLLASA